MSDIKLEPLQVNGVRDYHCHCDYSIDAEGTVDEFCQAALTRNLAEICFTTHFDANPHSEDNSNFIRINGEKKPVAPDLLAPYVDDVRRAADKFYPQGLSVKLGVEFGWYPGCEETVEKLRDRYQFDYMLAGIHEIDNICFCCKHQFEKFISRFSVEEAVEKYYHQVVIAARSGLFNTIAHLGYYMKYSLESYGEAVRLAHRPYLKETFAALVAGDTALEVNTAAIRHGLNEYYPSMEIINAAKKAGVEVIHLGSDAHRPEQVGFDFEAAVALVPDTIADGDD